MDVWKMVEDYIVFIKRNGYFDRQRTRQAKYWMYETINSHLLNSFYQNEHMEHMISEAERKVLNNELSSFIAANQLLEEYYKTL